MKKVRTRFAPSPTGFMHIGNLRTALYGYLFARKNDGEFILRVEDTDQERKVEGAIELVYRTLQTAGIEVDESPLNEGSVGPYIQSERKAIYKEYAEKLVELGGAYYCFCDKERLDSLTDDKGNRTYDKHCLKMSKDEVAARLASGDSYVIRQNIPETGKTSYEDMVFGTITIDCAELEDNVLLKSDGLPTYNFANVVDDHLMAISHVIRGTEYLSSTPKYNLIYQSFGWELPQYMHLSPIMKDEKRKLSKRFGDANFEDFVAKGYLPEAIINYIALLGWSPKNNEEKMTMAELQEKFSVEGLTRSGSIFDENKLKWLNSQYIKELAVDKFKELAHPYYEKSVIAGKYDYDKFSALLQSRIDTLGEIIEKVEFICDFGEYDLELFLHKKMKMTYPIALEGMKGAKAVLETTGMEGLHDALVAKAEELELKKGQILWALRIGVTGQQVTPGGATEMVDILGVEQAIERLNFSMEHLSKVL